MYAGEACWIPDVATQIRDDGGARRLQLVQRIRDDGEYSCVFGLVFAAFRGCVFREIEIVTSQHGQYLP